MKRIRDYFEKLGKKVVDLQIDHEINNPCFHCGYGTIITGSATIVCNSDNESDIGESENVNFIFKTGCLTYDAELVFE